MVVLLIWAPWVPVDDGLPVAEADSSPPPAAPVVPPRPPQPPQPDVDVPPQPIAPVPVSPQLAAIDLLQRIDLKRDVVHGDWRLDEGELIAPRGSWQRLQVPVDVPREYVLQLEVSRNDEPKYFLMLGLIVDGVKSG